jgi:hypothetical protein
MKVFSVKLESASPYSQSRHYDDPELDKEGKDAYDARTWRSRMHVDENGYVYIPPMSIKNCLSEAAAYLGVKIKGKGQATYKKHFESGVLVLDRINTGVKADDVKHEALFVPADGVRGGGKRVVKRFPRIDRWSATFQIHVVDDTITKDILEMHLKEAGNLIGIGRFRPRKNGYYGRFTVATLKECAA